MRHASRLKLSLVIMVSLAALPVHGQSTTVDPDKLPEPVARTFKSIFPAGTIVKLTSAEENGMTVYDFEFKVGDREKETDIVSDGTMIESTLVIAARDIPAPAMKTIQKAAKGAKLGRLEWIETRYDIKEGKTVLLAAPVIKYAAEMTRKAMTAEIIVDPRGAILEEPEWVSSAPAAPPADGRTSK